MAFDKPYIPNVSNITQNALQGYKMGASLRQDQGMAQAGAAMQSGDQKAAANALYGHGMLDQGMALEKQLADRARQATADQLAREKRRNELFGNIAMLADTPEKWEAAIGNAIKLGVKGAEEFRDFSTRNHVISRAGRAKDLIELELKRRQAEGGGKPTASMREYQFDMQQRQARGAPVIPFSEWKQESKSPLVTIEGEKAYDKTGGEALRKTFGKLQDQASQATSRIGDLRRIDSLLSNPNVYTGTGATAINALKRTAQTLLGQEHIKGVADADAARRISTEMALSLKENLPGPMSDADREFLQTIPPNIGDTAEGRKLLVELMVEKEQRKIEIARLARQYAQQQGGRLDDSWYTALSQYNQQNPVFSEESMARARQIAGAAEQPSPAAGTLPQVQTIEDYNKLEVGQKYIDPSGEERTKYVDQKFNPASGEGASR